MAIVKIYSISCDFLEGELHVYIDGVDNGIVWTGLPTHKQFWGVADVFGRTTKNILFFILSNYFLQI